MSVSISPSTSSGKAPLTVVFSVTSTDNERDRLWDFGDGTTSTEWTPTHYYQNPGSYVVLLTTTYNDTCCPYSLLTATATTTITVTQRIACYSLDKCYWVGDGSMDQGVGAVEFTGDYFPQAAAYIPARACRDTLDNERVIIFDNNTSSFREIFEVDGATGSGLSRVWIDEDVTGADHEISGYVEFPEFATTANNEYLEFLDGSYTTVPYDESKRSTTGYDSAGYRSNQEFDLSVYVDGAQTATNTNNDAVINGEVSYDYQVKGKRGRARFAFAASEFYLLRYVENWMLTNAKDAPTNTVTTEITYQSNLGSPSLWFTRGSDLTLNRATGSSASISVSAVTGPDNISSSAMSFTSAITLGSVALTGTLTLWYNGTIAVTINGNAVSLTSAGTHVVGAVTWTMGYANYTVTSAGNLVVTPTGTAKIFDIRQYSSALTGEITYLYNDIVNNAGNRTIPIF